MSAIAGILRGDSQRADPASLELLDRNIARLGPDSSDSVLVDSLGMTHRAFYTTYEARKEVQPMRHLHVTITFDGRLDNRTDLFRDLAASIIDPTDVGLVATAYNVWGLSCFSRLVGDFAIAVWDSRKQRLLLCRDSLGVRGLYYHTNADRIVWASNIDALLGYPGVPTSINPQYIASYLVAEPPPFLSPFESIQPVEPGHVVTVDYRTWSITNVSHITPRTDSITYKSDREYEEHFRSLFIDAVASRLRADRPVMSQLSGGLDSSAIVCIAESIVGRSRNVAPRLSTVSFVFSNAPSSDERKYISIVERWRRSAGIHIAEEDAPILSCIPDPTFVAFPSSSACFGGRVSALHRVVKQSGSRILLSGFGGDHILLSEEDRPLELADLLARGQFAALLQTAWKWALVQKRSIFELLYTAGLEPTLRLWVRPSDANLPTWLSPVLAPAATEASIRRTYGRKGHRLPSAQVRGTNLLNLVAAVACGQGAYHSTRGCLEVRYPFLHRPLLEFLLAIPVSQIFRPGERRSLMRRALKGHVPHRILWRRSKRGPDEAISMAFKTRPGVLVDLLDNSRACEMGYLVPSEVRKEIQLAETGRAWSMQAVLRILALEIWLRSVESWRQSRRQSSLMSPMAS